MYLSSNDWAPNDLTYAPGVLSEPSVAVEPVIRFLAGALRRDLFVGAKCQRTPKMGDWQGCGLLIHRIVWNPDSDVKSWSPVVQWVVHMGVGQDYFTEHLDD